MARRPKRKYSRRKRGKYLRGNVDEKFDIATLAALALVQQPMDETVNERTFISSAVCAWSINEWTAAAGVGPLMVGYAHSDYTAAEIEEFIENLGSWNEGDQIAQERGRRKIKVVGIFQNPDGPTVSFVLNDGKPIYTKLNWMLLQGQNISTWGYNLGTQPFATTDPEVRVQGKVYLWPK